MVAIATRRTDGETAARRGFPVTPRRQVDMERRAFDIVARHPHFRGHAANFQFLQHDDVLIVRGCVPSFYLKQILQTVLRGVDGVAWIDNQVDVVACDGLSSARDE